LAERIALGVLDDLILGVQKPKVIKVPVWLPTSEYKNFVLDVCPYQLVDIKCIISLAYLGNIVLPDTDLSGQL
jgi:hypothetical protein